MHDPFIPNHYYHLYNHGVGDENLFRSDENYAYFLKRYGFYISPVCQTFAYCLMPNHFHFLIRLRNDQQIRDHYYHQKEVRRRLKTELDPDNFDFHKWVMLQFQNLLNGYAQSYNHRFKRKGALFIDYTRRKIINHEAYLYRLLHYIHYNPIHHGFCNKITDWKYSSYNSILSEKATQLERDGVLEWFGDKETFKEAHKQKPDEHFSNELEFY